MNSGIRDYTEEDCRWVEFAKCMRSAGLQIEALIEYVTLFQQGDRTRECRKQLLVEQRDKLQIQIKEMQQTMERLDKKIARYEQGHGADGKRTQTVKKRQVRRRACLFCGRKSSQNGSCFSTAGCGILMQRKQKARSIVWNLHNS